MANRGLINAVLTLLGQPLAEISLWKKCRQHLGAPLLQKVVDFDPTSSTVTQELCRDAIKYYQQTMPYKSEMLPAAQALHDWLGAVFWVRKEMRAAAAIVRQTTIAGLNETIAKGDVERVRTILEVDLFDGAGPDEGGLTALHAAATKANGDSALVELILSLDCAADMVNTIDTSGKTALHHAVQKRIASMVHQVCDLSSTLDAVDGEQCTALMYAVINKDMECATKLLASGADVNVVTEKGAAMDLAAGWNEGQELLQSHGAMSKGALTIKNKKNALQEDADEYEDEM